VRGLIVGFGSIGRRHARNWQALDLGPLEVAKRGELESALAQHPDVVLVTNPTSLHLVSAQKAVEAGAHVLIEKPVGHTLEGVEALLDTAERRGKQVLVAYNFRFHPLLVRMHALVREGAIGKILSARAEVGEYLPDFHPWEDYRPGYAARRELGGGPVLTFSHDLDTVCWILGAPTRVTAFASHASQLEIDTEDVAEIVLQFADGALASVHVDFVRRPTHRSLEVTGESGVLRWESEANRLLLFTTASGRWRVEEGDPRFDRNDMYLAELRALRQAIDGEPAEALATGPQGAAVLAIALAALRSADKGQAIALAEEPRPIRTWLDTLG
jgi:predicted dehydrogenase